MTVQGAMALARAWSGPDAVIGTSYEIGLGRLDLVIYNDETSAPESVGPGCEATGGGYQRVSLAHSETSPVTFDPDRFEAVSSNSGDVPLFMPTESLGVFDALLTFDDLGALFAVDPLDEPLDVIEGEPVVIPAGQMIRATQA